MARQRALGVGLLVVLVLLGGWRVGASLGGTIRGGGPDWPTGLAAARERCAVEPGLETVEIPVQPAGWSAVVPCAVLRD